MKKRFKMYTINIIKEFYKLCASVNFELVCKFTYGKIKS